MEKINSVTTEELIEYRKSGHSVTETAEHFGMNRNTVKSRLVHLGVGKCAPQYDHTPEQKIAVDLKRKNRCFEYAGGYHGSAASFSVRCTLCGSIFKMSAVTVRSSGEAECPVCKSARVRNVLRVETFPKHWEIGEQKRLRKQEKKQEKEQGKKNKKAHSCPVCGEMTTRKKYCSVSCSTKAANSAREFNRRTRVRRNLVDKDITLKALSRRDGGICWICGLMCDWDDNEKRNGTFIAGPLYPSIDHIVPISAGGEHSWRNVKLAHRSCNTFRYYDELQRKTV